MSRKVKDKYEPVGEGFEIDIVGKQILQLACCDCGLVHDVGFAIEENGNLGIAIRRNEKETAKRRKRIPRAA